MDEWTTLASPVSCRGLWRNEISSPVGLLLRDPAGMATLVGDVNDEGGTCGGCCVDRGDVAAYRRVWGDGSRDAELFASLARAGAEGAGGPS